MNLTDAEWSRVLRPYPFRVRPYPRETLDSFTYRLLESNFDGPSQLHWFLKIGRLISPASTDREIQAKVVTSKAGLPADLFRGAVPPELQHSDGTRCVFCSPGTGDQWVCRLCARGMLIPQTPHLDHVVCLRHHLWVGSGTSGRSQIEVEDAWVKAEYQLQRLRRLGLADAWTLWELSYTVDPSNVARADRTILPLEVFPTVMAIWTLLHTPRMTSLILDPSRTYASRYRAFERELESRRVRGDTAERVWIFLRPAVLEYRERALGIPATAATDGVPPALSHNIRLRLSPSTAGTYADHESFAAYLQASGTTLTPETWRGLLCPRMAGIKKDALFHLQAICPNGHRIRNYIARRYEMGSQFRCPQCELDEPHVRGVNGAVT